MAPRRGRAPLRRVTAVALKLPGDPATLIESTRSAFAATYDASAIAVGHAPGRVNLIGEHTDYNGGLCLPVALPHRTYAAAAARSDNRIRIASRQQPQIWAGTLDEIGPGHIDGWAAYAAGVWWALQQALAPDGVELPGVDLMIDSTVPLGAGLSSSAAVECAVATAALGLLGEPLTDSWRRRVVEICMRAESEVANAPTGGMDQTISMLAESDAALLIDFRDGAKHPVALGADAPALLVMDTGVSHALNDGGYASRRRACEQAAEILGVTTLREATLDQVQSLDDPTLVRRGRHVVTEIARVTETVDAIGVDDWDEVGRLFLASHASLRDDFEVSCPELDLAVETAVAAGARGARMTGGGFGGSAIALVEPGVLDEVAAVVAVAFDKAGFKAPTTLIATPSGPADYVRL